LTRTTTSNTTHKVNTQTPIYRARHILTSIHTHIHKCTRTHTRMFMHTHAYTHAYTYTHRYSYTHTHMNTYTSPHECIHLISKLSASWFKALKVLSNGSSFHAPDEILFCEETEWVIIVRHQSE